MRRAPGQNTCAAVSRCLLCGLALLGTLALAGCVGGEPVPQDHFYRLPALKPAKALPTPLVTGTLGVERLRADGLYQERAMLYIERDHPLQVQRYHYHHWAAVPGTMIQQSLVGYLRAAGAAAHVERAAPGLGARARITGRVLRLERMVGGGPVRVVVELELHLSPPPRAWGDEAPRDSDAPGPGGDYRAKVRAADASMDATVQAYGKALERIYGRFLHDARAAAAR